MMSTKGFMAVYFNQSSGHSVTNEQKFKLGEHRTMDNEARQSDNTGQIKEVISLIPVLTYEPGPNYHFSNRLTTKILSYLI